MMIGTRRLGAKPPRHLEPVHARQAEIEHDQIGVARRREDQRVFASPRAHHLETGVPKVVVDYFRDARIILDDQDRLQVDSPSSRSCARRCHSSNAGGTPCPPA